MFEFWNRMAIILTCAFQRSWSLSVFVVFLDWSSSVRDFPMVERLLGDCKEAQHTERYLQNSIFGRVKVVSRACSSRRISHDEDDEMGT